MQDSIPLCVLRVQDHIPHQKYIHYIYIYMTISILCTKEFSLIFALFIVHRKCIGSMHIVSMSVSICCVSLDVIVLRDSPPPQLSMPNHQNQGIQ